MSTLDDAWRDALARQERAHAEYQEQVRVVARRLPADQAAAARVWYRYALDPDRTGWGSPRVEVARTLGIPEADAVDLLEDTITAVEEHPAARGPLARWREASQSVYLFTRAFRADAWETDEEHEAGLGDLLDEFTAREEGVLRLRFGFHDGRPRTLEEVGTVLGISPGLVLEIETEAVRRSAARVAGYDKLPPGVWLP